MRDQFSRNRRSCATTAAALRVCIRVEDGLLFDAQRCGRLGEGCKG